MALSLRPISAWGNPGGRDFTLFAELVASGNYATGGDTVTYDTVDAPDVNGFLERPTLSVGKPPIKWEFNNVSNLTNTYIFDLVPGVTAYDFKVKVYINGAELAAGAYPADLTTALPPIRVALSYRQNI
ncbi:MAG: hypothetical protein KGI66_01210 [Patescibacteria group bacterium]|nr:hypothetical protein [Patescibacteria group bacterium]